MGNYPDLLHRECPLEMPLINCCVFAVLFWSIFLLTILRLLTLTCWHAARSSSFALQLTNELVAHGPVVMACWLLCIVATGQHNADGTAAIQSPSLIFYPSDRCDGQTHILDDMTCLDSMACCRLIWVKVSRIIDLVCYLVSNLMHSTTYFSSVWNIWTMMLVSTFFPVSQPQCLHKHSMCCTLHDHHTA